MILHKYTSQYTQSTHHNIPSLAGPSWCLMLVPAFLILCMSLIMIKMMSMFGGSDKAFQINGIVFYDDEFV